MFPFILSKVSPQTAWMITGILFGLFFPVFAILIDTYFLRATPVPLATLLRTNPIHFVVMLAPFVLGATFWTIGYFHKKLLAQMSSIQKTQQEHWYHANRDILTGLGSRYKLTNDLAQHHDRYILLLDIKKFKSINESFGHDTGDAVLCSFGASLQELAHEKSHIYRLGGDEFIILGPIGSSQNDGAILAQGIIDKLKNPLSIGRRQIYIQTSIGIAPYFHDDNYNTQVLGRADLAHSRAKVEIGSNYVCFTPRMTELSERESQTKADLDRAFKENELFVEFQPIHCSQSRNLKGAETLVRWQHPRLGRIMPDHFVRIAEESGQIIQLGAYVLRESCRAARNWHPNMSISVNVSVIQLRNIGFIEMLQNVLKETDFPPQRLVLEITETVLIEDEETINATMKILRNMGIRIALDDFGEGFTSVSHLLNLGLDKLKLDKSLTNQLTTDPQVRGVVRGIVDMCDALNIETTIEGVELQEEFFAVQELGIALIQGFYFSRPMTSAKMLSYIQANTPSTSSI